MLIACRVKMMKRNFAHLYGLNGLVLATLEGPSRSDGGMFDTMQLFYHSSICLSSAFCFQPPQCHKTCVGHESSMWKAETTSSARV